MGGSIWAIALLSISLSAVAQLLMKIGMTGLRSSGLIGSTLLIATATNPYITGGFAAYGLGAVFWLKVLSRADLSLAYPLVSLGFLLVAVLSWLLLGEHLSLGRVAGIALIVLGVALIGYFST
jgi:multidrug transporter EmrE-like cation transporter